jgi:phosphate transport system substrate-binding protein
MVRLTRLLVAAILLVPAGCAAPPAPTDPIVIDGSSTLAPLTEAVVADFQKTHRNVPIKLASVGTAEGFTHFCRGGLDILDASRPVSPAEQAVCVSGNVTFIELPVAQDALTVMVNVGNTWASSITVSELRKLWEPAAEAKITRWNQIRSDWPDRPVKLFGPGPESGTFDYFTEVVTGTVDSSRKDYTMSKDDMVIVRGVAADVEALGYAGYGYFDRNRKVLKALAIDDEDDRVGRGPIEPSPLNVGRGVYRPFARPLFIYVNQARLTRPELKMFVDIYVRRAGELALSAGAAPLTGASYELVTQRLAKGMTGTMFRTVEDRGQAIDLLLNQ